MKRKINGLLLWIINNALVIAVADSLFIFLREPAPENFLKIVIFGIPWIITGGMIAGSFVDAREKNTSTLKMKTDDYKSLINVLKENDEAHAIEAMEKYHKEIESGSALRTIKVTEVETIAIEGPPVGERWTVFVRNFEKGTHRVYNSDGLQEQEIADNIIPYGTKIIYHGTGGWEGRCYCGHYNREDDTYNIYNGWDLCHIQKENIEVCEW